MTETTHQATLSEQFQAGLERGELLIQTCHNCGRPNMYPRHFCPFCQSDDLGWETAAGTGVLHSFTVVRAVPPRGFEPDLPYALGVVKLDEGVQLTTRLEPSDDGEWTHYACDARVSFSPEPSRRTTRGPVAWFRLQESS
jgi:uncharacterized protein